jgi:hypothetical protein
MTDFTDFSDFLKSLPKKSPVIAFHTEFKAAVLTLEQWHSKETVIDFARTATALRESLEDSGHTKSNFVNLYAEHIERGVKLAMASV